MHVSYRLLLGVGRARVRYSNLYLCLPRHAAVSCYVMLLMHMPKCDMAEAREPVLADFDGFTADLLGPWGLACHRGL